MEKIIAISKYGNQITINPDESQRIIIQGISGSGKSVFINVIVETYVATLRNNLLLWVCDPKVSGLSHLRPRCDNYINEPSGYIKILQELNTIIDQRYVQMQKIHKVKLCKDDFALFPMILLVIDEYNTFINNTDLSKTQLSELKKLINSISVRCRACNVSLILCGQQFQTSDLDSVARGQFTYKIILQSASQQDVALLYPEPEICPAWLLNSPGTAYIIKDSTQPILSKTWYTNESEVAKIMEKYAIDKRKTEEVWVVNNPN